MVLQSADPKVVTILVADERPIIRQGWRALLRPEAGFQVAGEAADGLETLRLASRLQPHVVVLEWKLPGLDALELLRRFRERAPETRIIVLSRHFNQADVRKLVRAGAVACVLEGAGLDELLEAIGEVLAGKNYFSPTITPPTAGVSSRQPVTRPADFQPRLTPREREIVRWTVSGQTSAEIAAHLHISRRTVESHRANIMHKLRLRNQKELIRWAVQWGFEPAE